MANGVLFFNGKRYISTRQAAKLTGYTSDYIGQISRAGKIDSRLIARVRFVDEEGLLAYGRESHGGQDGSSAPVPDTASPITVAIRTIDTESMPVRHLPADARSSTRTLTRTAVLAGVTFVIIAGMFMHVRHPLYARTMFGKLTSTFSTTTARIASSKSFSLAENPVSRFLSDTTNGFVDGIGEGFVALSDTARAMNPVPFARTATRTSVRAMRDASRAVTNVAALTGGAFFESSSMIADGVGEGISDVAGSFITVAELSGDAGYEFGMQIGKGFDHLSSVPGLLIPEKGIDFSPDRLAFDYQPLVRFIDAVALDLRLSGYQARESVVRLAHWRPPTNERQSESIFAPENQLAAVSVAPDLTALADRIIAYVSGWWDTLTGGEDAYVMAPTPFEPQEPEEPQEPPAPPVAEEAIAVVPSPVVTVFSPPPAPEPVAPPLIPLYIPVPAPTPEGVTLTDLAIAMLMLRDEFEPQIELAMRRPRTTSHTSGGGGDVDSEDLDDYLRLSGGTLTGSLGGTDATFTGEMIASTLAITGSTTFNGVEYGWPGADGGVNQVLTTDGAGALSWETMSSGSGSGTVEIGTAGALAFYPTATSTVDDAANLFYDSSTGNLGIGTTTPTSALSVQGAGSGFVSIGQYTGDGSYGGISLSRLNSGTTYNFLSRNTGADAGDLYINRPSGDAIHFRENAAADQMTLASGGNVGIGTTTPTHKLTIVSGNPVIPYSGVGLYSGASNQYTAYTVGRTGADGYFGVAGAANNYVSGSVAGDVTLLANGGRLFFGTFNTTPVITVTTGGTGNVGIGSTTPGTKLVVVGGTTAEYFNATSTTATNTFGGLTISGTTITNPSTDGHVNIATNGTGEVRTSSIIRLGGGPGLEASGNYLRVGQVGIAPVLIGGNGIDTTVGVNGLFLQNDAVVEWASGGAATNGDVGLTRDSAGVLRITNGANGGGALKADYFHATSTAATSTLEGGFSAASSLYVLQGGKVGIGTSSPYADLSVTGDLALTGGLYDNNATRGTSGMVLQSTGTGLTWVATSTLGITSSQWVTDGADIYYAAGQVGIGSSVNPQAVLHVVTTGDQMIIENGDDNNTTPAMILFRRHRAGGTAPGAGFGQKLKFELEGFTNGSSVEAGNITSLWETAQIDNTDSRDAALTFATMQNNSNSEKMRISSAGNLGIGTTSPYAKLSVTGDFALTGGLYDNNASLGSNGHVLQSTGSGLTWVATSTLGLGTGDVTGPSSATDNAIVRFDGATGELLQDSGITITDANRIGLSSNVFLSGETNNLHVFNDSSASNYATARMNDLRIHQSLSNVRYALLAGINQFQIGNNAAITWTSNSTDPGTGIDVGLVRDSAGILRVSDGSSGGGALLANYFNATSTTATSTFSGAINISTTAANGAGAILQNGTRFLHSYGTNNFFSGANAGNLTLTTGSAQSNTGVGAGTLASLTTGFGNAAFGANALPAVTNGSFNTALGQDAMANYAASGQYNVAVGRAALYILNDNGSYNTALGGLSLFQLSGASDSNTAVGYNALSQSFSGSGNTAVGVSAGVNGGSMTSNTFIGYQADVASAGLSLSNATAIGYNAKVGASNTLILGGTGADAVNVGIGTTDPGLKLTIQTTDGFPTGTNTTGGLRIQGATNSVLDFGTGGVPPYGNWIQSVDKNASAFYPLLLNPSGGNVGIGTTSPYAKLSVTGDFALTGGLYDNNASLGSNGMVLQSTGSGVTWVATSTLGLGGGSGSGTVGSGTTGQLPYYAADGTTLTATSSLFLSTAGNVGIGLTNPNNKLTISDTATVPGTSNGSLIHLVSNTASNNAIRFDQAGQVEYTIGVDANSSSGALRIVNTNGDTAVGNSSAGLFVVSNGDVGVGAAPDSKFEVTGNSSSVNTPIMRVTSAGSQVPLYFTSGTGDSYIKGDSGGNFSMGSEGFITYETGGFGSSFERMRITSTGLIGMGTDSPNSAARLTLTNGGLMLTGNQSTELGTEVGFIKHNSGPTLFYYGTDKFIFKDGSGSGGDRIAIDTDGNLGVGSIAPLAKLDVTTSGATTQIRFGNSTTQEGGYLTSAAGSQAILSGGASHFGSWVARATSASVLDMNTGDFNFYGNTGLTSGAGFTPTLRMKIDSAGDVGIGTSNPLYKLHVSGTSNEPSLSSVAGIAAFTTDSTVQLTMGGYTASPFGFWLQAKDSQGGGGGGSGTAYPLLLNPLGGNVGVGTTTPWRALSVVGTVGLSSTLTSGTTGNYLCINTSTYEVTSGTTCSASSARFKENIIDLEYGLDEIKALRPVTFSYKKEYNPDGSTRLGLIAEEVAGVIPEVVNRDKEGRPESISYENLISLLIKGVQEIAARLDTIEAQLAAAGTSIQDGVTRFMEIVTDRLTVGSEAEPSGITLYDEITGEPFCLSVRNGEMVTRAGTCDAPEPVEEPAETGDEEPLEDNGDVTDNGTSTEPIEEPPPEAPATEPPTEDLPDEQVIEDPAPEEPEPADDVPLEDDTVATASDGEEDEIPNEASEPLPADETTL